MDIWENRIKKINNSVKTIQNYQKILNAFNINFPEQMVSERKFKKTLDSQFIETTKEDATLLTIEDTFLCPTIRFAGIPLNSKKDIIEHYSENEKFQDNLNNLISCYSNYQTQIKYYKKSTRI